MDMGFDYKLLAWLRRGSRRKKILIFLDKQTQPVTPTEIKRTLGFHLVKVSVTLRELREKELVELLNPEDYYERLFQITKKGREMVKTLIRKGVA